MCDVGIVVWCSSGVVVEDNTKGYKAWWGATHKGPERGTGTGDIISLEKNSEEVGIISNFRKSIIFRR